jgi:hypothetical protein
VNKFPPCKIIVITGNDYSVSNQELTDPTGEFKVSHFLKKPVAYETLLEIILKLFFEAHDI